MIDGLSNVGFLIMMGLAAMTGIGIAISNWRWDHASDKDL